MHYRDNDRLPPKGHRSKLTTKHVARMNLGKYAQAKFGEIEEGVVKDRLRSFITNMREFAIKGFGLYIHGDYGSGKTHAAAVILKQACIRGYSCYLVQAADLASLKITKGTFDSEQTLWDRLTNVHFLVIDDLGKEHESEWAQNSIVNLLRERNRRANSVTIMTSNLAYIPGDTRSGFARRYGRDTQDLMDDLVVPLKMDRLESYRVSRAGKMKDLLHAEREN